MHLFYCVCIYVSVRPKMSSLALPPLLFLHILLQLTYFSIFLPDLRDGTISFSFTFATMSHTTHFNILLCIHSPRCSHSCVGFASFFHSVFFSFSLCYSVLKFGFWLAFCMQCHLRCIFFFFFYYVVKYLCVRMKFYSRRIYNLLTFSRRFCIIYILSW